MMNIKNICRSKVFLDSFWTIFGTALGKGLTVLSGIIVANFLGKNVFGEYGFLKNTLMVISIFSTMGLGYTSTIHVSKYRDSANKYLYSLSNQILGVTFSFSFFVALFVFIFAPFLAYYLKDESLVYGLRFLSFIIIFNAITTTQVGILSGLKLFKEIAETNILSGIFNFLLTVLLTYFWGFNGALLALLFSQVINCFLNYRILRKNINVSHDDEKIKIKPILIESLPIALQEMSLSITHWSISVLLLRLSNYGEVGLYSAATQWTVIISFIPVVLRNVTLSHLSSELNERSHNKLFLYMLGLYFSTTFFLSLLITIFSSKIVGFYGDSFSELSKVLIILSFSTVFTSICNAFFSEFMSKKKNWFIYGVTLSRDIFILLGIYIFIVKFSVSGALAISISTITMGAISVIACCSYYYMLNRCE